jgi:hypothetical protein
MKKAFCVLFFLLAILLSITAQEAVYKLAQKDIDEFIGFADEYKALAAKVVRNVKNKSVSEIFYTTDNDKLVNETVDFLKNKGWSYDKMSQFLYTVYLALIAIDYTDSYTDTKTDNSGNLFEDVTKETKTLVRKNKPALDKYFPKEDYSRYEDDTDASDSALGKNGKDTSKSGTNDTGEPVKDLISGDIAIEPKVDKEIKISVVFVSGADELALDLQIFKDDTLVASGEPKTVKPWTVKGGRIENSWTFAKNEFKKGTYTASVTVTDKEGNEAGSQTADFTIK